ncbi:hypothetical protein AYO21_01803 [Fonsecaea monophora]|uniref:ER membrane protein complex subunit 4 n=1 Tax=Fonsecaea monophora TaxID=254056 RepID=A0A177FJK2_9EURO|nr:hypothetical protein AYO21_01803 [Fonsecaea monophora]KAH0831602.1 hypothetical protein FOPE_02967 [Fonsecaea pedrosoi]OAG43951.1 hypothetical protein AYO21_01803 [Fonsecaea monophora]
MAPPMPKWVVDLNNGVPSRPKNISSIPDPPGFSGSRAAVGKQKSQPPGRKPPTPEETETLKLKKAWEVALGPAKQLPMQAIMGYMSGNSLQIFSIMMVFMLSVCHSYFAVVDPDNSFQFQEPYPGYLADKHTVRQIRERW